MVALIFRGFVPIVMLILFVLGAIFFGFATPSEGAALGALGGLVLAAVHRRLSFGCCASPCSSRSGRRDGRLASGWLKHLRRNVRAPWQRTSHRGLRDGLNLTRRLFWVAQVLIFLLGWRSSGRRSRSSSCRFSCPCSRDTTRGSRQHRDQPVFFGIMAAINQQTSFLSPPVAMSAYYLKGVVGKLITLNEIFQGMYPFMAIQIVAMLVLWFFPQLAYFLPDLVYGAGTR